MPQAHHHQINTYHIALVVKLLSSAFKGTSMSNDDSLKETRVFQTCSTYINYSVDNVNIVLLMLHVWLFACLVFTFSRVYGIYYEIIELQSELLKRRESWSITKNEFKKIGVSAETSV